MKTRGSAAEEDRFDLSVCIPLLTLHLSAVLVIWTGVSGVALGIAVLLFVLRAFGLTAGYHRYFSHRAYRTSRPAQFALAFLGASAAQQGPLWWAAHHRRHHRYSDQEGDPHSPVTRGLWWAHMGWLLCKRFRQTDAERIKDFIVFPELRFLDRFHWIAPLALAALLYALGAGLGARSPQLGTSAAQMVVCGFILSTLALYHVTYAVNSLGHSYGSQPYDAGDGSRNNPWLAPITLGDGWHNNHHRFPRAARHGFHPSEPDPTFWALRALAAIGLVWDLHPVPAEAYAVGGVGGSSRRQSSVATTIEAQPNPKRSPKRP